MDDLALADDQDPVGETEHLLDLAGDDHDGDAAVGERPDQLVDLGAGADVDAAGGLVEQQHPAVAQQPSGQHDLLLVAAGQGADGAGHAVGGDVEAGGELGGAAPLLASVEEAEAVKLELEFWRCEFFFGTKPKSFVWNGWIVYGSANRFHSFRVHGYNCSSCKY